MARRSVALLVTLGLVAVGCGGEQSSDAELLAERVERVATLVDTGRDCDAATAATVVGELATVADVSEHVRQEVVAFARAATTQLACDPAPEPTPSDTPIDRDDEDDEDDEDDKQRDEDEKQREEEQKQREEERKREEERRRRGKGKGNDDDDD